MAVIAFSVATIAGHIPLRAQDTDSSCMQAAFLHNGSLPTLIAMNLRRALGEADICIEPLGILHGRSVALLRQGLMDIEVSRVASFYEQVKEVAIQVEEPLIVARQQLFYHPDIGELDTFWDLPDHVTIGAMRDAVWHREFGQQHGNFVISYSEDHQLQRLLSGEVQAIFIAERAANDRSELEGMLSLSIGRAPIYMYLHRKHQAKYPAILKAIRDFKGRGQRFDHSIDQNINIEYDYEKLKGKP